ncbi:hypothetical protein L7F22_028460 [Adiantum nelumboides]|nr:hypothetical protein [Adiantum nelumboides]
MGKALSAEVKARFPVTFEAARDVARLKERKLRYQLQHQEVDQEGDEGVRPPPSNVAPPHRGPRVVDQQELLSKITSQLENLVPRSFGPKYCICLHRQCSKMVSTIRVKIKAMALISGRSLKDIVPIVDAYVKGQRISNIYVDGGTQICVMSEHVFHRLGLKISAPAPYKAKMANNVKVKCLGIVNGVRVKVCEVEVKVEVYVVTTKGEGDPIILGRPWLMAMQARQDWGTEMLEMILAHRAIQPPLKESTTLDESDCSREEVMGLILIDPNKVDPPDIPRVEKSNLAKILAKDLTNKEKQAYLTMLEDFPRLFIKGYDEITRVTIVQHHINLKEESKPTVQRLRRLGVIQQDALLVKDAFNDHEMAATPSTDSVLLACPLSFRFSLALPQDCRGDPYFFGRHLELTAELRRLQEMRSEFSHYASVSYWISTADQMNKDFFVIHRERPTGTTMRAIRDGGGALHADPDRVLAIVTEFYEDLFTAEALTHDILEAREQIWSSIHGRVTDDMRFHLMAPFIIDELRDAVHSLSPFSCPGDDGLIRGFFATHWEILHIWLLRLPGHLFFRMYA